MQSLHKNENLLFKDFQDFLARKQRVPENRLPYYLRWVSRYHEFCSRENVDGSGKDAIASYLQDLAKDHEDWQVQQAKEAVRLYRYFKGLQEVTPAGKPPAEGQVSWQSVEEEIVRALRLRHRSYRTEQSYRQWLRRFGAYLGFKEPQSLNQQDLEQFLSHLAVDGRVSSTTQRVAFNALLFLFRHVLAKEISALAEWDGHKERTPCSCSFCHHHFCWKSIHLAVATICGFQEVSAFKLTCHDRNLNFSGEITDMGCITFFEPPTVAFDNEAVEKFL